MDNYSDGSYEDDSYGGFSDDFNTRHRSLTFYMKQHEAIAEAFVLRLEKVGFINDEFNEIYSKGVKELRPILLKIMNELRELLKMLDHVDLYRDEYDEMFARTEKDLAAEMEREDDQSSRKDKMRKFGIVKFLSHYQNRYDELCESTCGKNTLKVDIDGILL